MNKRQRNKFLKMLRERRQHTKSLLRFTKRIGNRYRFYVKDNGDYSFGDPPAFHQMEIFCFRHIVSEFFNFDQDKT
ncbi:MAG: hypothetical protein AABY22_19895, partial [Nanoarchaeota archaeon]